MWPAKLGEVPVGTLRKALLLPVVAAGLYALGFWLHIPYGGGHIYSDVIDVFQNRLDSSQIPFSPQNIPYVNTFVEYPPLTGLFIYAMGVLGSSLPLFPGAGLVYNYYVYTAAFLSLPTTLLIRELLKVCDILGVRRGNKRVMLFFVATPSFLFMVLLNWYIIGVFLATLGLRTYLQGSRWGSGFLFGASAGSSLVTAAPAFGLLLTADGWRQKISFAAAALGTYLAINLPFMVANSSLWTSFWSYEANWYIEGSWMLGFLNNESPLRHYIFPASFALLSFAIVLAYRREKRRAATRRERAMLSVKVSSLFTFAYLFSTYVFTPQMNLILLPFFVVAPLSRRYWEFLAFEIVNALVIVYGFSGPLLAFGVNLPTPLQFGPVWDSPIQALAVARSLWVGKFLIYDGLLKPRLLPKLESELPRQVTLENEWLAPRTREMDAGQGL
ncbi:MAG: hypothetical protein OK456_03790 [Thaumarchaeota archaeon]|nr:hypothetical protein [Nitrososphaerota archaeon]